MRIGQVWRMAVLGIVLDLPSWPGKSLAADSEFSWAIRWAGLIFTRLVLIDHLAKPLGAKVRPSWLVEPDRILVTLLVPAP